ncbi:hypothetical protein LN042_35820 [Kitasatospora sp. RB6PN24]|uniref:hypothetical protein n=1 Tax=Kitasatospora humi TaxID=2893891 RepID=UPI001E35C77D|nr:hypothetical protein [Kitasatospora humi]MCC9312365.1 hypothetical protein [Kitasatospora humi]
MSASLGAELVMSEFFLVSIVTSADPAADEFSRSILNDDLWIPKGFDTYHEPTSGWSG